MGKQEQRPSGAPGKPPRALPPAAAEGAAAAAAAAAGRTELVRTWTQYLKGKKRREAAAAITAHHECAPSATSCLILAKMGLLRAGEAAVQVEEGAERERAVLACLHSALRFAAAGAADHRSFSCLHICALMLHVTRGRPGHAERRPAVDLLDAALGPSQGLEEDALLARGWADPLRDGTPDKWNFEPGTPKEAARLVAKACKHYCSLRREYAVTDTIRESGVTYIGTDNQFIARPADDRLATCVVLLPDSLHHELEAKHKQREAAKAKQQGGAQQVAPAADSRQRLREQQRRREEEQKAEEERNAERRRKRAPLLRKNLPALQARAAKIAEYLQSRLAAATEGSDSAGSSAAGDAGAGRAGAEQPRAALDALLQLSALSEAELRALMVQEKVEAEQQAEVLAGLAAARSARPLRFHLPPALAAKLGPLPENVPSGSTGAEGSDGVRASSERLCQQLRHLFYHSREFAAAQASLILGTAPELAAVAEAMLGQSQQAEGGRPLAVPDSVEAAPQCDGDMELLLRCQGSALNVGLVALSAVAGRSPRPASASSSSSSSSSSSDGGGGDTEAADEALLELETVDEFLPDDSSGSSAPGSSARAQRAGGGGGTSRRSAGPEPDAVLALERVAGELIDAAVSLETLLQAEGSRVFRMALDRLHGQGQLSDLREAARATLLGAELLRLLHLHQSATGGAAGDAAGAEPREQQLAGQRGARQAERDEPAEQQHAEQQQQEEEEEEEGQAALQAAQQEAQHGASSTRAASDLLGGIAHLQSCWGKVPFQQLVSMLSQGVEEEAAVHATVEAAGRVHTTTTRGMFPAVRVGAALLCARTCAAVHAQAAVGEGLSLPALHAGLQQTRQRLCDSILAGLRLLAGSCSHRAPFRGAAEFVVSLQPGRFPGGGAVNTLELFASLGHMPLPRLLQLQSFLALALVCLCASPDVLLHAWFEGLSWLQLGTMLPPAELMPAGGVRLSEGGTRVMQADADAYERFAKEPLDSLSSRIDARHRCLLTVPERAAVTVPPRDLPQLLAGICTGLVRAEADAESAAGGRDVAALDAVLQGEAGQGALVAQIQQLAFVRRVCGGVAAETSAAERVLERFMLSGRGLAMDLRQAADNGGLLNSLVRQSLVHRLHGLRALAREALERVPAVVAMQQTMRSALQQRQLRHEEALGQMRVQQLQVQLPLLPPGQQEEAQAQLKQVVRRLVELDERMEMIEMVERLELTSQDDSKRHVLDLVELLDEACRLLETPYTGEQELDFTVRVLPVRLRDASKLVAHWADSMSKAAQLLAVLAAARGEASIRALVLKCCVQPSLEPVFAAMTQRLLAAKWDADAAQAAQAAEEATRQAALAALLAEEEEGSAAQARQERQRAKKAAKKAAKKDAKRAVAPAPTADPGAEQRQQAEQQAEQQQQQQQQQQSWEGEQEGAVEQHIQRQLDRQAELERQWQQQQQRQKEEEARRRAREQQERAGVPQPEERPAGRAPAAEAPTAAPQPAAPAAAAEGAASAAAGEPRAPGTAPAGDVLPPATPPAPAAQVEAPRQPRRASPPEEERAAPAPADPAAEEDGWEQAPSHRRGGKAARAAPAAAAPSAAALRTPLIVGWEGHWACTCGNPRIPPRTNCADCGALNPCREYLFEGGCSRGELACRFRHPPFALPPGPPPAGLLQSGRPLVNPPPGTPLHGAVPPPDIMRPAGRGAAAQPRSASQASPASSQAQRHLPAARQPGSGAAPAAAAAWPQPGKAAGPAAAAASAWQQRGQAAAAGSAPTSPRPQAQSPRQAAPSPRQAELPSPRQAAQSSPRQAAPSAAPAAQGPPAEQELEDLLGLMGLGSGEAGDAAASPVAAGGSGGWGQPSATAWGQPAAGAPASWAKLAGSGQEDSVGPDVAAWPEPGQSQEDAELQAAIQASLADAAGTMHAAQQLNYSVSAGAAASAAEPDGDNLGLAGLRNETGEYNCFLNVIIQCLWRCADFRRQVAGWDAAYCSADEVVGSLHALFQQLQQQEEQRRSGEGTGGTLPPVDPSPLREALAQLPGQQFRVGEMNDAAEVLLSIYERVMEAAAAVGQPAGIAPTFGLSVREEVHCSACGKTTHQCSYTQYFYNTQATGLQLLHEGLGGGSTGELLRQLEAQHPKSCDTDMAGCGALNPVNHLLETSPRVFTLQLAWESHSEQPADIAATLAAIDEEIDLGEVYQGVERGTHRYRLCSMVCYYGQHYQALVLVPDAGGWLMFDDTRVSRVGDWADVRRKCEAGRIQPSVLFYEAAAA